MGVIVAALLAASVAGCGPQPPVTGEIIRGFAPAGRYAGHWGIDYATPFGSPVAAPYSGLVTFAGSVAGRLSVTIEHGGGLRSSLSYLSTVTVTRGGGT